YPEIRRVVFQAPESAISPGPGEAVVVARRFTAIGELEETSFALDTRYGSLQVEMDEVVRILFGEPQQEPSPAASGSAPLP
ncbi:MAG: hypothetical protein JXP34_04105, partial [Planctomycetes bacterium]|nr:hypothetical protein [Planctomycetota bacterium]